MANSFDLRRSSTGLCQVITRWHLCCPVGNPFRTKPEKPLFPLKMWYIGGSWLGGSRRAGTDGITLAGREKHTPQGDLRGGMT